MHPRSHEGRCIRTANADSTSLAQLLCYERILVRYQMFDRRRTSCAGHAFVLHAVFERIRNSIERTKDLTRSAPLIASECFVEDIWIDDWYGVETRSSAVVGEDSQQVFRRQLHAGDRIGRQSILQICDARADETLLHVRPFYHATGITGVRYQSHVYPRVHTHFFGSKC